MDLKTSSVQRSLDARLKIGGIEAQDLLVVLIVAAVMNIFFGQTSMAALFVFIIPSILFLALFFGKRGKPEGYLLHYIRFLVSPGAFDAGCSEDSDQRRRTWFR